jgi:hypothetical protein
MKAMATGAAGAAPPLAAAAHSRDNPRPMATIADSAFLLHTRGGLHLQRLALEARARGTVRLLPWLETPLPRSGRIVCATGLAPLLPPRKVRPLAVPYRRAFQLGNMTLELHPAGAGLGSAVALVHAGRKTLCLAMAARLDALHSGEPLDLPDADVIVLDARNGRRPHTPVDWLLAHVQAVATTGPASGPIVWCIAPAVLALEVAALFPDPARLRLTPSLAGLFKRAWAAGHALPPIRPLATRPQPGTVVLCTPIGAGTLPAPYLAVPRAEIGPDPRPRNAPGCLFARAPGHDHLLELALRHPATDVVLVGMAGEDLAPALENAGKAVTVLDPTPQLPLI